MSLRFLGTGSALPKTVISNEDLTTFLDTSDEWITARTGIRERRCLNGETLTELAVLAGKRALEDAGVKAAELDIILCATVGGEYLTPTTSCMVQKALGATCPAIDISAACSGFIFALDVAAAYVARGAKKVLVLGAENLSRYADWTDRRTCVLFGDGAGAVLVGPGDGMPYIKLFCDGFADPLYIPGVNGNCPKSLSPNRQTLENMAIHMDGGEVYKFAVRAMVDGIHEAMQALDITPEQVDHVFPHQANLRIIDAARKKLGIPPQRFHVNIDRVGNMSAASVPVLLDECNRAGLLQPGQTLVLNAFGGGLTVGTAVVRWG